MDGLIVPQMIEGDVDELGDVKVTEGVLDGAGVGEMAPVVERVIDLYRKYCKYCKKEQVNFRYPPYAK